MPLPDWVDQATWRLVLRGVSLRELREEWTLEDMLDASLVVEAEEDARILASNRG